MPVLFTGDANFSEAEDGFLNFVCSDQFPWYVSKATANFPCLSHTFVRRTDKHESGEVWSNHWPAMEIIFRRICKDNNITVRDIYRSAANLTFSDPSKHGDPHNDHPDFPHKIMLIYINNFDDGGTWLFDENGEVEATIPAERDKFVVFEGGQHANGFCKPQQTRIVLVTTFDGDVN